MTLSRFRTLALLALVGQCLISVTGAAVRLTGSGLGCSEWPTCENGNIVAEWEFHAQVEFINRLITGVVCLSAGAALLAAYKLRPRDQRFVKWSALLVGGIFAQALVGAMVTKSDLLPNWVAVHFLLSAGLVAIATVQLAQANDLVRGSRRLEREVEAGQAPRWQRPALGMATAAVLLTGPLVTGSGPHAGDEHAHRWNFALTTITRAHSITAWALVAVVLWIAWTAVKRIQSAMGANPAVDVLASNRTYAVIRAALITLVLQGAVGYLQYATKLPPLLVGIHVAGAMGSVVAMTYLSHTVTPRAAVEPASTTADTLGDPADSRPGTVTP